MKTKLELAIILFGVVFVVAGCSEKTPKVNNENCKIQNIGKIKDAETRAIFAEKCFQNGEIVKNPARYKSY